MIDLEQKYLKIMNEIFDKYLKGTDVKVYLFGSRAKGTTKRASDIDLALESKSRKNLLDLIFDLKEAFEESDIIYSVDIIDLNDVVDSFKKYIVGDLVEVW